MVAEEISEGHESVVTRIKLPHPLARLLFCGMHGSLFILKQKGVCFGILPGVDHASTGNIRRQENMFQVGNLGVGEYFPGDRFDVDCRFAFCWRVL